ncbi:MAG: tail fiber protein [Bacteroidia bacterium]|nr:tail fiber protein [Bacteroidia bacterium]
MNSLFLAEISMFGGNFAPRGWALCDGQLLPINQHQALFSLLGTTYGGDGRTTFALPDLRSRGSMHPGHGAGLSSRLLGQKGGTELNVLNINQMPSHNHTAAGTVQVFVGGGDQDTPTGHNFANAEGDEYSTSSPNQLMQADNVAISMSNTGANQAINNVQPFECVNFIIALQGNFPSRN